MGRATHHRNCRNMLCNASRRLASMHHQPMFSIKSHCFFIMQKSPPFSNDIDTEAACLCNEVPDIDPCNAEATYQLGLCFANDQGVPEDLARTTELYNEACQNGSAPERGHGEHAPHLIELSILFFIRIFWTIGFPGSI